MELALQMGKTIEIFPETKSLSARDRKVAGGSKAHKVVGDLKARKVAGGSSTTGRASTVARPGTTDGSSLDRCRSRVRRYSNSAAPSFKDNSGSGGYGNNRDDENSEDSEAKIMRTMRIARMPRMMKMVRMVVIMMMELLTILVALRSPVHDRSGIHIWPR